MTIDELIAKLEAATEGSRQLDFEIWHDVAGRPIDENWAKRGSVSMRYTTSIDAALTLVPNDGGWLLFRSMTKGYAAYVGESGDYFHGNYVFGATPALALCIAALRARTEPE